MIEVVSDLCDAIGSITSQLVRLSSDMPISRVTMSKIIAVVTHPLRLLNFVLLDRLFQFCDRLLLGVHCLCHACNHFLLPFGRHFHTHIVLVLYKLIVHSLLIIPALVLVQSVHFDAVVHVFQPDLLRFLPRKLFLLLNRVILYDVILLFQAIVTHLAYHFVVILILHQYIVLLMFYIRHASLFRILVFHFLLLGFPCLLSPQILHHLEPSILL